MEIHFFDVDHTITAKATGIQYLTHGIRKRIFPLSPLFRVPGMMIKYRKGHLTLDRLCENGIPPLKGLSLKSLEKLSYDVFHKKTRKIIFSNIERRIKELQGSGKKIVLASSSVDFILKPLAEYLGTDDCIASSFSFNDGLCTGLFDGEPCFGPMKRQKILEYIQAEGSSPEKCYFYSDSIHDLPLLEAVGFPVIVNPDKVLAREAVKRNWEQLPVA